MSETTTKSLTLGIMTCGGDCPGLNPVIRAVTITAISKFGWKVIGIEDSMQGLINIDYKSPNGNMELTLNIVQDIISKGGTILGNDNKSDPFRFAVEGPDGTVKEVDVSDKVIENYHKLKLDAMIVVGGDGTMQIAQKLIEKGNLAIVGIPKTIDNDLPATDYTFGFNTAVQTISNALDQIRDTARSHDRVLIVEVMGRDAGWLALHGGISGCAHVLLIPEIPFKVDVIAAKIKARDNDCQPFTIIVIAEGASPQGGTKSFLIERKAGEMLRYGGIGHVLADALTDKRYGITREIRVSTLGYIQRGGTPSNFDRILGTQFGVHAVELVHQKKFGRMVSLQTPDIVDVSLVDATRKQKLVDPNGQLVHTAKLCGICFGDELV